MAKLSRENLIAVALAKLKEKGLEPLEGKGLTVNTDNVAKKATFTSLYYIGNQSGYRVASCVFIGSVSKYPKLLLCWSETSKKELISLGLQDVTQEELEEFHKEEEHHKHIVIERVRQLRDEAAKQVNEKLAGLANATEDNAYLKRKGIPPSYGVKVGSYYDNKKKITVHDCLYIPKKDAQGFLRSCEIIQPDGTKKQWQDAESEGLFHEIHAAENCNDDRTFILEGFANAQTAHIATYGARAISCGDAYNLLPVVTALLKEGKIDPAKTVIIPDNDWKKAADGKGNVGLECAIKAAAAIGCKIIEAVPIGLEMEGNPKGCTDINDLMQLQGIDAVRKALASENASFPEAEEDEERPICSIPYPPKDIFPKPLEDAVDDVASIFSRGNTTFATVGLLSAFAHGINGYCAVYFHEEKPIYGNAFILLVGNSSSSKSDCQKAFLRPFIDKDSKAYLAWKKEHDEYLKAIKKWNLRSREQKEKDAVANVQAPQDVPAPVSDMQGQDITSEGLFDVMWGIMHHDGVACASIIGDEASEMLQNLDAYKSNGSKSTNKVIEMWDAGVAKKTRAASGTAYRMIPKACLTITGNTQPVELCNMFSKRDLLRGLANRFILIRGKQTTPPAWPERTKLSEEAKDAIDKLCAFMFEIRNPAKSIDMIVGNIAADLNTAKDAPTTKFFRLSPEAYEYWKQWYNATGKRFWLLGEEKETLFQKLSIYTSKIALYIHIAKLAFKQETDNANIFSLDTVQKATRFTEYIAKNSMSLWNMILGNKTAKEIPAPALKLAEIIVHHANDIDEKTRFVTNDNLKKWCQEEGIPIEHKNQIATLAQSLELARPTGVSTSKRGRVVTLEDIERLVALVEASKIDQE